MFGKYKNVSITAGLFAPGKVVCRKCGVARNSDVARCGNCGSKKYYKDFNEYLETTYTYCANCGKINFSGYTNCPDCGCARFIDYNRHISKGKNKSKLKNFLIGFAIFAALCLLAFAIWAHIYYSDTIWPGILILVLVYNIVMILTALIDYAVDEDLPVVTTVFFSIDTVIGIILSISFLFISELAIWGWAISLAMAISSITFVTVLIKGEIDKNRSFKFSYIIIALIFFILFIIATLVIQFGYGWALYF